MTAHSERGRRGTFWNGRKPVVLINGAARNGKKFGQELVAYLTAEKLEPAVVETEKPGNAPIIVSELMKEANAIFVVGGDGTLTEAAGGVVTAQRKNEKAVLVFVPGGTANLISRRVIPGGLKSIKEMIQRDTISPDKMDALKIMLLERGEKVKELVVLGHIGFGVTAKGAEIIMEKRPGNRLAELKAVTAALKKPVKIKIEGRDLRVRHLLLSNVGVSGRYIKTSNALIDDGLMEVVINHGNLLSLFGDGLRAFIKGIKGEQIKKLSFEIPDGTIAQIDGEILNIAPKTEVVVSVLPGAIPMVTDKCFCLSFSKQPNHY